MLQRRCFVTFVAMLLILAASLAGCARHDRVLARVGTHVVTEEDFLAAAPSARANYPGPPEQAKAQLLDDMVKRELLLSAAEAQGLFRDTLVTNYRRLKGEEMLAQAIVRGLTPASVPVTDGELARLHAWRDSVSLVQVIYVFTR